MNEGQKKNTSPRAKRHKKIMLWSFLTILLGALLLPIGGYVHHFAVSPAVAAEEGDNPRANFWREVRGGNEGYTAVVGQETNVFIQNGGQNWRQLRNGPVASLAPWVMGVVLLLIAVFYLMRGRVEVENGGASGETVERWSAFERGLHWFTAILFIILAITGLSMFFGRAVLIPIFGPQGFAAIASLSITAHNYLGPFFVLGILIEIITWIRFNLLTSEDITWLKCAGGMFSKDKHPHAGRFNAGEKVWFWVICTFGVATCVTGLILDFPNFGQVRETMQLSNLIHSSCAIIWMAVSFGHIYLGTIGTEGTLEGMTTGRVSAEWAKQHHDRWYDEECAKGNVGSDPSADQQSNRSGATT